MRCKMTVFHHHGFWKSMDYGITCSLRTILGFCRGQFGGMACNNSGNGALCFIENIL